MCFVVSLRHRGSRLRLRKKWDEKEMDVNRQNVHQVRDRMLCPSRLFAKQSTGLGLQDGNYVKSMQIAAVFLCAPRE